MEIERLAAFSIGGEGGNAAAVVHTEEAASTQRMQEIAAQIGYSETVFACPEADGWKVRYFAPEMEVPFCGHATIALGASLAKRGAGGTFRLFVKDSLVTVEGLVEANRVSAAFQSLPTDSKHPQPELLESILSLFGIPAEDLDSRVPPKIASAGARHFILTLSKRESLRNMKYDLALGRELMRRARITTIMLVHSESSRLFHVRNAFASGGVYEDPATGAAAAALAGYLRELRWPHAGRIEIAQGEDMGIPCRILAEIPEELGSPIRISGEVRMLSPINPNR